jgi:hypothetical protein
METAMQARSDQLDVADPEQRVQAVYRQVALVPTGSYRFEMGRSLALRL